MLQGWQNLNNLPVIEIWRINVFKPGFPRILKSPWIFFSSIFKALKVLENRVVAWNCLNLSYWVFQSPGIFLVCNTVICRYSYCWSDEHLVTGIYQFVLDIFTTLTVECWFNDSSTLSGKYAHWNSWTKDVHKARCTLCLEYIDVSSMGYSPWKLMSQSLKVLKSPWISFSRWAWWDWELSG